MREKQENSREYKARSGGHYLVWIDLLKQEENQRADRHHRPKGVLLDEDSEPDTRKIVHRPTQSEGLKDEAENNGNPCNPRKESELLTEGISHCQVDAKNTAHGDCDSAAKCDPRDVGPYGRGEYEQHQ